MVGEGGIATEKYVQQGQVAQFVLEPTGLADWVEGREDSERRQGEWKRKGAEGGRGRRLKLSDKKEREGKDCVMYLMY